MLRVGLLTAGILLIFIALTTCRLFSMEEPDFRFLIISDLQVRIPGFPDDPWYESQTNLDNLNTTINTINTKSEGADFLVVTGDMVGCLFSEDPDDYGTGSINPAETMKSMVDQLTIPWYPVLGNHDYHKGFDAIRGEGITTENLEAIEAVWEKVLGIPPYYSTLHKGVNLIFLNSNRGIARSCVCPGKTAEAFCTGSFDETQMTWLTGELEKDEPAIIFSHHPPATDNPKVFWSISPLFLIEKNDLFYDITFEYREKIIAIFTGHGHLFRKDLLHGTIEVCETAAIGDNLSAANRYTEVDVFLMGNRVEFYWNDQPN